MADSFSVPQGDALSLVATLKDSNGVILNSVYPGGGYDGSELLSTAVWPGGDFATLFTVATIWDSAPAGTILITVSAVQTATLYPGVYSLATTLDDSGLDGAAYQATITVTPAAGGIVPDRPPTIITLSESLASIPGLSDLSPLDQVALVQAASDWINRYCGRYFPLATHDETHQPDLTRTIRLHQYPVNDVLRVAAGMATGMSVANGTLVRPTVSLMPASSLALGNSGIATGLKLGGYAAGVPLAPTTLAFAAYPTIQSLVTAVNALGSGWTATLGNATYADLPSTDLNPEWGTKGVTASGTPLRIYSRDILRYEIEPRMGVISIYEDRVPGHRYPDRLWAASGGYGGMRVTYTAGFNADPLTGPVTMPDALKRAAFVVAQILYQRAAVGLKKSEKTTVQSMSYDHMPLSSHVADLLAPFRRRTMV